MQQYDLVVIGSGPAGQRAAVQAAKIGKKVAVIERRSELGGVAINTGTIPSKTLREAVIDLSGLRQRTLYGESFRGKSEITIQDLLFRCDDVMRREREVVKAQLQRNGIKLYEGLGRFASPTQVDVEGTDGTRSLGAAHVLIAVGTVPGLPDGMTVDHQTVLTSDDVLMIPRIPRTMTVVGAGIIGTEYATMFAALGVEVTLIDKRTTLLEMVDRELVDQLVVMARERNVTLRLGEEVAKIENARNGQAIVGLRSGKRFATEMVLVSAGRTGATASLGLETIGLQPDARGRLNVDGHFRTAVPNVYAAGDVIGAPGLASTSAEQGRLATCSMFGIEAQSVPETFPYGIYAIPEIAWVGRHEAELTAAGVPFETGVARYREIARGHILGDDEGMLKIIFHIDTRAILGVWVMGTDATDLVHIGQAVMALGGTLDYFLRTVFNYPTLAECYKVAAYDGYNKLRQLGALAEGALPPGSTA